MAAVTSNNRPAPFPKSEMAGIISPMIMSGMAKVRKLPNSPLKVTNIRATGTGRNCPSDTCRYGDEDLPQEGNPKFFHNADAFSKNRKIFPFCQGNAALSFTEVLDLNR